MDRINVRESSKLGLLAIPGAVVAALPILACALCWPAYAALISSLGVGFLGSSTYLLPLTGVLLAVALVGLGWQIKSKGRWPFIVGLVSVAMIIPGKFFLGSQLITYGGVALLVLASGWSVVPQRSADSIVCSECAPRGEESHQST